MKNKILHSSISDGRRLTAAVCTHNEDIDENFISPLSNTYHEAAYEAIAISSLEIVERTETTGNFFDLKCLQKEIRFPKRFIRENHQNQRFATARCRFEKNKILIEDMVGLLFGGSMENTIQNQTSAAQWRKNSRTNRSFENGDSQ